MTDIAKEIRPELNIAETVMRASGFSEEVIRRYDPSAEVSMKGLELPEHTIRIAKQIASASDEGFEFLEDVVFTPQMLIDALDEANGEPVALLINCPGGSVTGEMEMCSYLSAYQGATHAVIMGAAFSAASVIASACDRVTVMPAAMVMIHAARGLCLGDAEDMREVADMLDKMGASATKYYEKRMSAELVNEFMTNRKDNFMTADEAMEAGFADDMVSMEQMEDDDDKDDEDNDNDNDKKESEMKRVAKMKDDEFNRMLLGI